MKDVLHPEDAARIAAALRNDENPGQQEHALSVAKRLLAEAADGWVELAGNSRSMLSDALRRDA